MSNVEYLSQELPDGCVIGQSATSKIAWYGGTPTAQLAYQAAATDTTGVVTGYVLWQAWAQANGMMA